MAFNYIPSQISTIEFEPVKIEDLRVVVGVGAHVKFMQKMFYRNFVFLNDVFY